MSGRKTHKEYLEEIMERVRDRERNEMELKERIKEIEAKKNIGKKKMLKEPTIIGYLSKHKSEKRDFYGVVYPVKNIDELTEEFEKKNNIKEDRKIIEVEGKEEIKEAKEIKEEIDQIKIEILE